MREDFSAGQGAATLVDAYRSGALLPALPEGQRPTTLTQALDIQDKFLALVGGASIGWKMALGGFAQKRTLGFGRALPGRILASRVYQNGGAIPMPNAAPVTIEFEIAYVLARDILPEDPEFPVRDAIAETRVTFELVRARYVDRRAVGWLSFAADNCAFDSLVLGPDIPADSEAALAESLVVIVDGVEASRSLTGDDVTDPIGSLGDLIAIARERGVKLPKGSVISTGTLCKPFDVIPTGVEIEARFLGKTLAVRLQMA
jgi:2-keto-4-pentenoate hydratase